MNEGWTDLHTHVLPGIDDGAIDESVSLAMVRKFREGGVTTIAATPHLQHPRFEVDPTIVKERLAQLNHRLLELGDTETRIVYGGEVRFSPDLGKDPDRMADLTYGGEGRTMLLELPFEFLPESLLQVIFELCGRGVTPILAHAERYFEYQDEPEKLEDIVHRGALIQVNASSLTGHYGRREKKLAHLLLKRGLVHVLASDAHDTSRRPPGLQEGVKVAAKILGETKALRLVRDNPARLLRGDDL